MIKFFLRNIKSYYQESVPALSVTSINSNFQRNREHLDMISLDRSIFNGYDLNNFVQKFKKYGIYEGNNSVKENIRLNLRSWFDYTSKVKSKADSFLYGNTMDSVQVINNAWNKFGPFDVIIGISQGFTILLHWLDPILNGPF